MYIKIVRRLDYIENTYILVIYSGWFIKIYDSYGHPASFYYHEHIYCALIMCFLDDPLKIKKEK